MAYKTIPLFWTGTAMLLIGVVLVAALPRMRVLAPLGPTDADDDGEAGSRQADGEEDSPAENPTDASAETESAELSTGEVSDQEAAPEDHAGPDADELADQND